MVATADIRLRQLATQSVNYRHMTTSIINRRGLLMIKRTVAFITANNKLDLN